ncbi:CamS family sex pheromone protein [Bacillus licheniformis]|uniref:CamS family sex pheromone protein n=1 Tax=Bacillus licheniformis TaxID=1402 RepID=UPI00372A6B36
MIFKRTFFIVFVLLLALSGCKNNESSVKDNVNTKSDKRVLESYTVKTKKPAVAGGLITENIYNKKDISEIEMRSMELSKDYFSPEDLYYQYGQYLNTKEINGFLERKSEKYPNGLNPSFPEGKDRLTAEKESPKILSHILEQNYVDKDGNLKGITISLALNSVYYPRFTDKEGKTYSDEVEISTSDILKEGKEAASRLLAYLRDKKLVPSDVPILITLYQQEKRNASKPGKFLAKSFIESGERDVGNWDKLDMIHRTLSVNDYEDIETKDNLTYKRFESLVTGLETNFKETNFTLVGDAFYEDGEINQIEFNLTVTGASESKITAMVQYLGNLLSEGFYSNLNVRFNIKNDHKQKAIVTWDSSKHEVESEIY